MQFGNVDFGKSSVISTLVTFDDICSAIVYNTKPCARVHFGPPSETPSAPGGRQLVLQAANLTFKSGSGPNIHPSPFVMLLSHRANTHLPSLGG